MNERLLVIYRRLGGRESFTATAGEAAPQTAVHARKPVGFAASVATEIASVTKIHMTHSKGM